MTKTAHQLMSIQVGGTTPPTLADLIERHRIAYSDVNATLKFADDMHPEYDPERAVFVKRAERALWALQDQLAAFPVSTMEEVSIKAEYFREMGGEFTGDDLEALLLSIVA